VPLALEETDTFLGAVRVPSTSNKAIKPGLLAAIIAQSYPQKPAKF